MADGWGREHGDSSQRRGRQVYELQRQELFEPQRHGGTEKRKHSVNQATFTILILK